jgi:hypothetical protein
MQAPEAPCLTGRRVPHLLQQDNSNALPNVPPQQDHFIHYMYLSDFLIFYLKYTRTCGLMARRPHPNITNRDQRDAFPRAPVLRPTIDRVET